MAKKPTSTDDASSSLASDGGYDSAYDVDQSSELLAEGNPFSAQLYTAGANVVLAENLTGPTYTPKNLPTVTGTSTATGRTVDPDTRGTYYYAVGQGASRYVQAGAALSGSAFAIGNGNPNSAAVVLGTVAGARISGGYAISQGVVVTAASAVSYDVSAFSDASVAAVYNGTAINPQIYSGGGMAAAALSGQPTGGTIINPHVYDGGYALAGGGVSGFTVKGTAITGTGGYYSGGTFDEGSFFAVGQGGTVQGATIGGNMVTQSASTVFGNIFSGSGATQAVFSGMVNSGNTVMSGGQIHISGGSATGLIAQQGGTIIVKGGNYYGILNSGLDPVKRTSSPIVGGYTAGTTYNNIVSSSVEIIGSDGQASNSIIVNGTEIVSSGGTSLTPVISGGTLDIEGGIVSGPVAVDNNGYVIVTSGGTLTSANITTGSMFVDSSGTTGNVGIVSGSATIQNGGFVSGTLGITRGNANILSGGTVGTLSEGIGTATISARGTVLNNMSVSGGTGLIGGIVGSNLLGNDGAAIIITQSGTVMRDAIITNASASVRNGGSVAGVLSVSSGSAVIESGGWAGNLVAGRFGSATVQSGGSTSGASATDQGVATIDSGGLAATGLVTSGGTIRLNGTMVSGLVSNGGSMLVSGYGNSVNAVNGGYVSVASAATVFALHLSGGAVRADLVSGAILDNIDTNSGASVVIGNGVRVNSTVQAMNGGTTIVASGATISSQAAMMISGGSMLLRSGATIPGSITGITGNNYSSGYLSVGSGVMLDSAGITGNGSVDVGSGGSVTNISAANGGNILVQSGGSAPYLVMNGSGLVSVGAGVVVSAATAANGATINLTSGASVGSMVITNGTGLVPGGAGIGTLVVQQGGVASFANGASANVINVINSGVVSGATIHQGDTMTVYSGASAVGAVVQTYADTVGTTFASSGAVLRDTVISGSAGAGQFPGRARLNIESGAQLYNTSIGWGGEIRIVGLPYDTGGTAYVQGGTLYVRDSGQSWSIPVSGTYARNSGGTGNGFYMFDDGYGNTIVAYQCFLAGSLIRMVDGERAVEDVKRGDKVCVYVDGRLEEREVLSLRRGRAVVDKSGPDDMAGWSVIVRQGAFGVDEAGSLVPNQDLHVTSEHCFYFEGRLVPVRMLVNGVSIFYDKSQEDYEFYHVETAPHSIIWANNALTESYLEVGDRLSLVSSGVDEPDLGGVLVPLNVQTWEDAAAPLDISRAFVEPLYRRFASLCEHEAAPPADKAALLPDADVRLLLEDGRVVEKLREVNGRLVFEVPGQTRAVRILSRIFRPSEAVGPYLDDRRSLGVLVGAVSVWSGEGEVAVEEHYRNESLPGWSVLEAGTHRWTLGDGLLPLPFVMVQDGESLLLSIEVQAGGPYAPEQQERPALAEPVDVVKKRA